MQEDRQVLEGKMLKSVELFCGAGGLGMGLDLAGFQSLGAVEWNKDACDTIRENQKRGFPLVRDWPLFQGDARDFDFTAIPEGIDLIAGGPPCQPFSMAGNHKGRNDTRDMFPVAVDAVRRVRPRAFIMENVKGLTRESFANYFQYILLQFEFPEVRMKADEKWTEHLARLQRVKTSSRQRGLSYNVLPTLVNSANFGVPQKRERVFIVGFRSDLDVRWSFPQATHSSQALFVDQWVTKDYWRRHHKRAPQPPAKYLAEIDRQRRLNLRANATTQPWVTVRDVLSEMPAPTKDGRGTDFFNHRFQGGARSYPGHTGSPLDLPAKTLKAGDHGVPGGENMMVKDNGEVRYFSIRESARLQTFPDGYVFHGAWSEAMRQIGNAVPVALGQVVASSVARKLLEYDLAKRPVGRA
jgi:DNA (cytosine-5)-methyltransferase 1